MGDNYSYWEKTSFLSGYDVIIIGSGIVGLSAAIHLKVNSPRLRVGVLESGFLPSGASTKNAGFACFGSISELIEEIKSDGEDNLLQRVEMRWKGLLKLRKNLGDLAISFKQNGGYDIFKAADKSCAQECLDQIDRLNRLLKPIIGKHDIYAVANAKIAGFGLAGVTDLIENKYEGQIDTGRMMDALVKKAAGTGVHIFNNCRVENIQQEDGRHVINTSQGAFDTKSAILATNAFAKELIAEIDVIPGRGQVLVTAPIDNLKISGTFHYNRGYTYFRNIDNRVLLGGFRDINFNEEQTSQPGITDLIQNALEKLLSEVILPGQAPQIEHRWSGVMGFGSELSPIVKKIHPGLYCAVRCNGMGVAMGSLLGEQVADMVEL
ncbi:NAD(P)/FAD-dependent oxidoreductase [Daejeonella lutea]|uniref:Glycine/D-amino acid oxidase n=1 Tax=Daejeonella lutea TaxID=572036 RepID=A0A1T5DMP0_9SPHI|nr:FAD-binding oxidoreductase [Daejeonella lutea]SKB72944.1 Glycine/D-amino acid oxidase [Daejeonella lutea]